MQRVVLLGLADQDVDVLTRLAGMEDPREVIVVHEDPEALVVRLASLAELPTRTEPPAPDAEDWVVVSAGGDRMTKLVRPWKKLGARILTPEEVGRDIPAEDRVVKEAGARAAGQGPRERAPQPSKKVEMNARTQIKQKNSDVGEKSGDAAGSERPGALPAEIPPAAVWESPEATLRYLVAETLGSEAALAIWWDGEKDLWVPLVWTGDPPDPATYDEERTVELPSAFGRFRVEGTRGHKLSRGALTRLAEDLALRDLAQWNQTARSLSSLGLPKRGAGTEALAAWTEPVAQALDVNALLVWERAKEGWRLTHTWGESLTMSGELTMADGLLTATFEAPGTPWRRWSPSDGLLIHVAGGENDPRWPLQLRRVEQALGAEGLA